MSKTIKQLADELGVSKQTIRYHIKSLLVNKKAQESSLLKRLDLLEQIYHEQ
ncbi:HTH domain-containing protein, partial [Lactobacillus sp. XV13L]|nr:HTH domain-containing protein [Lactobacillus sp. XV13L]